MKGPRLVFRIYLIGVLQIAALVFVLWLMRPEPPDHRRPPPEGAPFGDLRGRDGMPPPRDRPPPPPPLVPPASRALMPAIIALALVGVSAVLTAAWLGRPLQTLSQAARSLGRGELSARTNLRRNDELGDVALAFDEMAARIEELVRAQRELLANVSHELRTPLARIRVALDLASEGSAEDARRSLAGIAGDLGEVERLVSDILASARFDLTDASSGAPPLRLGEVSLRALLDDSAARFRAAHSTRTLNLECTQDSTLSADRMLLRRALDNLLDNAARHSGEAAVWLSGSLAPGRAVIEVRDEGRGMSASEVARLFTPFFRADASRSRDTGGLGLGLLLARRIVEAHGGTIDVQSAPGRGTTVRVALPLAGPAEARI